MFNLLSGKQCERADPCTSNPCANSGQCSAFDSQYICTCTRFFTGMTCTQDVNECDANPSLCRNGGTCVNEVGGYRCRCPPEYVGELCESRYLPCNPSPCQNGGTCIQKGETSYECSCVPGKITGCVKLQKSHVTICCARALKWTRCAFLLSYKLFLGCYIQEFL